MMNWSDSMRTLFNHSCHSMPELADDSIQCVVTSPPYWGLRKYKGEQDLIWGGNKECRHEWVSQTIKEATPGDKPGHNSLVAKNRPNDTVNRPTIISNTCSLCGAWKGAYGLEPTVELYVAHSIEILREIRRVLRKDGVVFWNIGDSYASGKGTCFNPGGGKNSLEGHDTLKDEQAYPLDRGNKSTLEADNLKPKDLCLIPFRIALAAQSDGWWVRSVIIWNKPNPMPESVTDRPTESHEYIIMLTKSAKYYWDAESVREPQKLVSIERAQRGHDTPYDPNFPGGVHNHISEYYKKTEGKDVEEIAEIIGGRNLRSVWEFPTHGYSGAHFATFPEKLPEICIKAATPEVGCCSRCGRPWERIVERGEIKERSLRENTLGIIPGRDNITRLNSVDMETIPKTTLGWQPGCKCNADKVPSTVLDPFCGSGTTLEVAAKLGRKAVGYEISEEYSNLIIERNRQGVII